MCSTLYMYKHFCAEITQMFSPWSNLIYVKNKIDTILVNTYSILSFLPLFVHTVWPPLKGKLWTFLNIYVCSIKDQYGLVEGGRKKFLGKRSCVLTYHSISGDVFETQVVWDKLVGQNLSYRRYSSPYLSEEKWILRYIFPDFHLVKIHDILPTNLHTSITWHMNHFWFSSFKYIYQLPV